SMRLTLWGKQPLRPLGKQLCSQATFEHLSPGSTFEEHCCIPDPGLNNSS
ncbi:Hypothetical predicted protein, partial [Marmota monax]